MRLSIAIVPGIFLSLGLVAGCGDDTTAASGHDLGVSTNGDLSSSNGSTDGGAALIRESDIAAILDAVNSGEISEGQIAETQGLTNSAINDFATMMISMHGAAMTRQDALFSSLGITATANDYSEAVRTEGMRVVAVLSKLGGSALDEGYIDSQVSGHQDALDKLDLLLIPSATTPAVKTELVNTRATVAMHLAEAKALQGALVGLDD